MGHVSPVLQWGREQCGTCYCGQNVLDILIVDHLWTLSVFLLLFHNAGLPF